MNKKASKRRTRTKHVYLDNLIAFLTEKRAGFFSLALFLFVIMLILCIVSLRDKPLITDDWGIIQLYLIDYRVGFVSRALIGEIFSWFTDTVTFTQISVVSYIAIGISLIMQSFLAALVLRKAIRENNTLMILLVGFLVCSPITITWNLSPWGSSAHVLGLFDVYALIIFFIYLFAAQSTTMFILSPFLVFLGMTIHYFFALTFLPGIVALQFYFLCRDKTDRKPRLAFFVLTCAVGIITTIYFVFCAKNAAKISSDDLNNLMRSKWSGDFFQSYFEFYIYGNYDGIDYSTPGAFLRFMLDYTINEVGLFQKQKVCYSLMAAVPIGICSVYWFKLYAKADKTRKPSFLCFALLPIFLIAALLLSTDKWRFLSTWVIMELSILYTLYLTDEPLLKTVNQELTVWLRNDAQTLFGTLAYIAYFIIGFVFLDKV